MGTLLLNRASKAPGEAKSSSGQLHFKRLPFGWAPKLADRSGYHQIPSQSEKRGSQGWQIGLIWSGSSMRRAVCMRPHWRK